MTTSSRKIPFAVEIGRVIEVLAKQIYQSPLALLRENIQNAYDAILLRRHGDQSFEPVIIVTITPDLVTIADNGIGMSQQDLDQHFWRAGSSSKNTPEARAAGVVGTFGIGAMANFGIASELRVVTERLGGAERITCRAQRETLSATEDCIDVAAEAALGRSGTLVSAAIMPQHRINVAAATEYVREFVALLRVPVKVNGVLLSQRPVTELVAPLAAAWQFSGEREGVGPATAATVEVRGSGAGEIWIKLSEVTYRGIAMSGTLVLRQGLNTIRTFRSGFGLATVTVSSYFQFGGVADFLFFQPTAGREALSTESMQVLQTIVSEVDAFVASKLAERSEANNSTNLMSWAVSHKRLDLLGNLRMRVEPGGRDVLFKDIRAGAASARPRYYSGSDGSMIRALASDDAPLLVLSTRNPRRQCEAGYLQGLCGAEQLSDQPKVLTVKSAASQTMAEGAVALRVASVLDGDYFLSTNVSFGKISHSLPVFVDPAQQPTLLVLDPEGPTLAVILGLYQTDYSAFGSMVKDFVRNVIFPRVADLVPSSTRQGAETFLRTIRKTREVFEYETGDSVSLSAIWQEYVEGKLTLMEAAQRSSVVAQRSIQMVDNASARTVKDVVPDVIENQNLLAETATGEAQEIEAFPPIMRLETSTDAKLLIIADSEEPLKRYRCFIALSDRVREEKGDFFLQPHRTSIVWGGQKVLFVFQHHSGEFGLYYDLQFGQAVSSQSGGGPFPTCTIVLKNRVFIPVPEEIQAAFIPAPGERKRLDVRSDLLFVDPK